MKTILDSLLRGTPDQTKHNNYSDQTIFAGMQTQCRRLKMHVTLTIYNERMVAQSFEGQTMIQQEPGSIPAVPVKLTYPSTP